MSGLYNIVLGQHPLAQVLLGLLGFTSEEEVRQIPRLRDVYLFNDSIAILTRTGGGNRDESESNGENQWLRDRVGFIRDHDDEYDSTYAWWHYEWPSAYRENLQLALEKLKDVRPDLLHDSLRPRFEEAISQIGRANPPYRVTPGEQDG